MRSVLRTMALAGTLGLTACLYPAPPVPESRDQTVVEAYADVVFATYSAAHEQATAMQNAIRKLLDAPSENSLAAARAAWVQARQPYLQSEAFRFYEGPIDAAETGPEGRLNAWPLNEGFIDYVDGNPGGGIVNDASLPLKIETILGKDQVTDEADVTTGWHAIEFLLWGQDLSAEGPGARPFSDYLPGESDNDRRREYLRLVTAQLVDDLAYLVEAWRPAADNYRAVFEATPRASLEKLLTALATLSGFEIASERLAVGLDSGSQEDEHSCFSDTTHQDFLFDQRGIENVYFGRFGAVSGASVHDLLMEQDAALAAELASQIGETTRLVAALHAPYDQLLASEEGSAWRETADQALAAFERQADLLVQAGQALGLNVEILAE